MSSSSLESCPQVARPDIAFREFVPLRGPRGQALDLNAQIQLHILCNKCKELGEVLQGLSKSRSLTKGAIRHYQSPDLLRDSFRRGCHLCAILWLSLSRHFQRLINVESCDMTNWILTMRAEGKFYSGRNMTVSVQVHNHHPYRFASYETRYSVDVDETSVYSHFIKPTSTISTKGAINRSFYKKCLELCDSMHTKCRVRSVKQLPTRLLHIVPNPGSINDTPSVRLVLTGPEFSKDTKFAALSYCWGGRHGLQLEESNYQSLMKHIPFNELPATIQDSIMVTIELGMQYLWVDALCIIQNQNSNKDWSYEAGKMCDIYEGCSVAIAASGASNSTEGLFAVRAPLQQAECAIGTSLITVTQSFDRARSCWALETRGWALQEKILPARSIRFGSYVKWTCRELSVNEFGHVERDFMEEGDLSPDFYSQIVESPILNPTDEGETYRLWLRIIRRYTDSKLSYRSDKLAAIEGIRLAFQQRTGWAYACGLWQPFIMRELLWDRSNIAEPNGLRPSWSWVSMDGALRVHGLEARSMDVAKFVGMSPSSSGRIGFDSLVKLELSGVLFQTYEPAVGGHPRIKCLPVPWCSENWATIYETYDDKTRLWRSGDMALPLQIEYVGGGLYVYGLIVVPFIGAGAFERVGSFWIGSSCDPERIESAQVELLARSLDRGEQEPFVRRNIQLV